MPQVQSRLWWGGDVSQDPAPASQHANLYSPARLSRKACARFFMPQILDPKTEYPALELPLSAWGGYGPAFLFPLTHLPQFRFWVSSFFSSPGSPVITDQLNILPKYSISNALLKCFPTLWGSDFISNFQLSNFLPWRLYCRQQSHDSNDCISNKSLTEDRRI